MKTKQKLLSLVLSFALIFSSFSSLTNNLIYANSANAQNSSVLEFDVSDYVLDTKNPNNTAIPAYIDLSLDQTNAKLQTLKAIKKLRQDALDSNIPWRGGNKINKDLRFEDDPNNPWMTMRDYLASKGISEEEYLNPKWSNELEYIAIMRAAETHSVDIHGHYRPNGAAKSLDISYKGVETHRENISFTEGDFATRIDGFANTIRPEGKSEKQSWVDKTAGETGHYTTLIDPRVKTYAMAGVKGSDADHPVTWIVSGSIFDLTDESSAALSGEKEFPIYLKEDLFQKLISCDISEMQVGKTLPFKIISKKYKQGNLNITKGRFKFKGTLTSNTPNIVTVNGNELTAVAEGKGKLTFTTENGKTFPITIEVKTKIEPKYAEVELVKKGSSDEYDLFIRPAKGEDIAELYNPIKKLTDVNGLKIKNYKSKITKIILEGEKIIAPIYANSLFSSLPKVKEIQNLNKLDTSKVKYMDDMFENMFAIETLDVSKFDTSKVKRFSSMFLGCIKLKNLDVSKWDTSSAVDMMHMFYETPELETLDVSKWDVSNVTTMMGMFTTKNGSMFNMEGGKLKNLDLSKWDVSNVTTMYAMFYGQKKLESVGDLSNWNTSKVKDFSSMFSFNHNLKSLNVSGWDLSSAERMGHIFYACHSLKEIDVTTWDTSKVKDLSGMFAICKNLKKIDLSNYNTSGVNDKYGISGLFSMNKEIEVLDFSNFDLSNIDMSTDDSLKLATQNVFLNDEKLKKFILGEKSEFNFKYAALPSANGGRADDVYTGKWYAVNAKKAYTVAELKALDKVPADTYVWEKVNGNEPTATISIKPINVNISKEPVTQSLEVTYTGQKNRQNLKYTIVTQPKYGRLELAENGEFTYTRTDLEFEGEDFFEVSVTDGDIISNPAKITLNLKGKFKKDPNELTAQDKTYVIKTAKGQTVIKGLSFEYNGDKRLQFSVKTQPTHGTLTLSDTGIFTYVPDKEYIGNDKFVAEITDGTLTVTSTVNIEIKEDIYIPEKDPRDEVIFLPKFNIVHEYKSDNPKYILPQKIVNLAPKLEEVHFADTNVSVKAGTSILKQEDYNKTMVKEVAIPNEGVWKFVGWDKDKVIFNNQDIHFVGTWKFTPYKTTKWVDTEGKELKASEVGKTFKEQGSFDGYSFKKVETSEGGLTKTYIFGKSKVWTPIEPVLTTKWVDGEGKSLKDSVSGKEFKEADTIEGYIFDKTETDKTGTIKTHIFIKAKTTRWVEQGNENHKFKEELVGKEFGEEVSSFTEIENGVKVVYELVKTTLSEDGKTKTYEYLRKALPINQPTKKLFVTKWIEQGNETHKFKEELVGKEFGEEVSSFKEIENGVEVVYELVKTTLSEDGKVKTYEYLRKALPINPPTKKLFVTKWVEQGNETHKFKEELVGKEFGEEVSSFKEIENGVEVVYELVKTTLSEDGKVKTYEYLRKALPINPPTKKLFVTKWVEQGNETHKFKEELVGKEFGEEVSSFTETENGVEVVYELVKTTLSEDGKVKTYEYLRKALPINPPIKKLITKYLDENGTPIAETFIGIKIQPKKTITGYEYITKETDAGGNVIYRYKKIKNLVTSFVDKDSRNNIIPTVNGIVPKKIIPGYIYYTKETDAGGNVIYVYEKIEKVKEIKTTFVDKDDNHIALTIIDVKASSKKEIHGYTYIKSVYDKNGNVKHIYKKNEKLLSTSFVDITGKLLADTIVDKVIKDKKIISGYKYIRTNKDIDGNVTYVYKKIVELPKTGDGLNSNHIAKIFGIIGLIILALGFAIRKKK